MTSVEGIGNFGGFGGGAYYDPIAHTAVGALAAHGAYGGYGGFGFDYGDFHTLESIGDVKASIKDSQAEIAQGLHNQAMFSLKSDGDTDRRIAKTEADIRSDIKDNRYDLTTQISDLKNFISEKFADDERRDLVRENAGLRSALGDERNNDRIVRQLFRMLKNEGVLDNEE